MGSNRSLTGIVFRGELQQADLDSEVTGRFNRRRFTSESGSAEVSALLFCLFRPKAPRNGTQRVCAAQRDLWN
jgi:hypothetical protein